MDCVEDVFGGYWTVVGIGVFVVWGAGFHDGVFSGDALALAYASE